MSDVTQDPEATPGTPAPGQYARGSETGRPIMVLFDLLGRRWAITCLWGLREGPRTFRQLQGDDRRISPTSLNKRLAELRDLGLVTRADGGYALTDLGAELIAVAQPLVPWAERWAAALESDRATDGGRDR